MRDPNLASNLFDRDRVLSRETLLEARHFADVHGAPADGMGAIFSGSGRLNVTIPAPVSDLSRFNCLALVVENRIPGTVLVGLRLFRRSHAPQTQPSVSFSGARAELSSGQCQTLLFPKDSFGTYGTSTDWNDLESVELSFGYDRIHEGPADIEVGIHSLAAETRDVPRGPRLTRNGLFEKLRNNKQLERVLAPDSPLATRHRPPDTFGQRYSCRKGGLLVPPPHQYPVETADEVLSGRIMGQESGPSLCWDANPLGIQEWTHFLNRHHFIRTLVAAWVETQEERYTAAVDSHIASWITENPVPVDSNGGAGPAWETLSAAWRLREWVWVRRCAWRSRALSPSTRELMLRSIWEHGWHLMDHLGHPNNWIVVESCALALAGMWFPDFHDSDRWVGTGIERLTTEFARQFFADGTHFEISPLYHAICAHAMLEVRQSALLLGVPLPSEFDRPLERCFTYLAALCRPDFTWPSLNDSGSANGDYTALMRLAGDAFKRKDFQWLGTKGAQGIPPDSCFHVFPDAGIAVMRSGYTADANVLVFRAGPAGAAHVHDDVLSVDVTALGSSRLIDPGITTYAPDPLSDYYRSATAHNTVLVEGMEPHRASEPFRQRITPAGDRFRWCSGEHFVAAFGRYESSDTGVKIAMYRTVVFVESEYWIVRDEILGNGACDIATNWQFFPARVHMDPVTKRTRVLDARGPQFELIPVPGNNRWETDVQVGSHSPTAGWTSVNGTDVPSFSARYRTRAPVPFIQEWLLFPFRGRPHAGIEVERSGKTGEPTDLRVSFPDGRSDLLKVGPFPAGAGQVTPTIAVHVTRK